MNVNDVYIDLACVRTTLHIRIYPLLFAYFQCWLFMLCKLQVLDKKKTTFKLAAEMGDALCASWLIWEKQKGSVIFCLFLIAASDYVSLETGSFHCSSIQHAACVSLAEVGGRGEAVVWLFILAALRLICSQRQVTAHLRNAGQYAVRFNISSHSSQQINA